MTLTHTEDSLKLANYSLVNPGWHTHGTNQRTLKAVRRALELNVIETRRLPGGHNLQRQYKAKGQP